MAGRLKIEEWAGLVLKDVETCNSCKKSAKGLLYMTPENCGGDNKWHRICDECVKMIRPNINQESAD
jgi:hypothetical protein